MNSWIRDQWPAAHATLRAAGVADLCTYRTELGVEFEDAQAYVDFASQTSQGANGLELLKDHALVRLLFTTTTGATITQAPKNGSTLVFDDRELQVVSRVSTDEDSWNLICKF